MKPVVYDLAAGAVHAAAITVIIAAAIHASEVREVFRYSGAMFVVDIAFGFVMMFLMAFVFGGVFQLLSMRFDSIPPVVDDSHLEVDPR